jgi:uncharacterized repeat protein (TIGR01451 family)
MLLQKLLRTAPAALATLLVWGVASVAGAVGTQAGTNVDNQATVSYTVGTIGQTPIPSSPSGNSDPSGGAVTRFVVDRLVDLTVTAVPGAAPGYINVAPGSSSQVLAFDVTNTSNDTLDFELAHAFQVAGADPFGGTDNQNATLVSVVVDEGDGSYVAADDTETFIDELSATAGGNTVRVFVVSNFPLPGPPWLDGDVSAHILTATAREGGGATALGAAITADPGPEDALAEETVFGDAAGDTDAARNADHSATHAYRVQTATLTVTKTSTVVSDPVNTVGPFYAIPGAVIRYEVTVANTGTSTASAVTIQDDLSALLDGATGTLDFNEDGYSPPANADIQLVHSVSGTTHLTREVDGDDGDIDGVDLLEVRNVTLLAGESATVRFELTVR